MIELYRPKINDLRFKQSLVEDSETMSYNAAWGGAVPFPKERWQVWYSRWMEAPENLRFYRYLYDTERKAFVGEIAYRYDEDRKIYICDVLIAAKLRNHGYGKAGIDMICKAAKENGISELYDDIAADNPSIALFLKSGFENAGQTDGVVTVKKIL